MNILGVFEKIIRGRESWGAWRVFLASLFGIGMAAQDFELFKCCTGRAAAPAAPFVEAVLVCGRRSGKSFILALIAVFLAVFRDYRPFLGPGERAVIMVIAADRKQARVVMRYVRGLFAIPVLAELVENETAEAFTLKNSVAIEVATASHRTVRGYTLAAALCDEIAFWPTDEGAASPDVEIIAALRPAMATIPGALLLIASSPYARRGVLWESYRKYYGREDAPVLVWKADTRTMNPTVSESVIADAYERDPASAAAEFGAEFRSDVESLFTREAVEAVTVLGRYELPASAGIRYIAGVDPSGGSADSMTIAIAHIDRNTNCVILDAVRERKPPFSPDAVVKEFAQLLRCYSVGKVVGDRYAGEWPRERFRAHGVEYQPAQKSASEFYTELLPLVNAGRVELLDLPRLTSQLASLERRTSRTGKDAISHPPQGHDDICNSASLALVLASAARPPMKISSEVLARAKQRGRPMPVFV